MIVSACPPEAAANFYLGAEGKKPYCLDAKDFCTHALCVGMTGSGKTGLCIDILEEAALDGIPAIIIDPKGDIVNRALAFKSLDATSFATWMPKKDHADSEKAASDLASKWTAGLASWGIKKERIEALNQACDLRVYTPGSSKGLPINITRLFENPTATSDSNNTTDQEQQDQQLSASVQSLFKLLGDNKSNDDPETVFLACIVRELWKTQQSVSLEDIIGATLSPPINKIGALPVDTYISKDKRNALAIKLNSLIASPKFSSWQQGSPLDIGKMLYTSDGKPVQSIVYLAHLSEAEREFTTALILQAVDAWMRRQGGTSTLRVLLYIDEIFGLMPPTGNPPAKKLLLTLLKQARAFGVGCVLASQNPVDLDYKALSNIGLWFIGRLQTPQDRKRLLDGIPDIESDSSDIDATIASLKKRHFFVRNIHDPSPCVFQTRWAMSYLRGPIAINDIPNLSGLAHHAKNINATSAVINTTKKANSQQAPTSTNTNNATTAPAIASDLPVAYFDANVLQPDVAANLLNQQNEAYYFGEVDLLLVDKPSGDRKNIEFAVMRKTTADDDAWVMVSGDVTRGIGTIAQNNKAFGDAPSTILGQKALNKEMKSWVYANFSKSTLEHKKLKIIQQPGEAPETFHLRLADKVRTLKESEIDEIKDKFEKKIEKLNKKHETAQLRLSQSERNEKDQSRGQLLDIGESILGAFLGRRRVATSVRRAATGRRRVNQAKDRSDQYAQKIELLNEEIEELTAELEETIDAAKEQWSATKDQVTERKTRPLKRDIEVKNLQIVWA